MDNVKVRLNIALPGGVMYSKSECYKVTKKKYTDKKGISRVKITESPIPEMFEFGEVKWKDIKTHKIETVKYKVPKCRPASKVINLTNEAYAYMISTENPYWVKKGTWNSFNRQQRLEAHLNRIAEHNGGVVSSYQVLED